MATCTPAAATAPTTLPTGARTLATSARRRSARQTFAAIRPTRGVRCAPRICGRCPIRRRSMVRSCGSIPTPERARPETRLRAGATPMRAASWPRVCATRSALPSARAPASSGSATSARTPGKRSIACPRRRRLRTSDGRAYEGAAQHSSYSSLGLCQGLYAAGSGAVAAPYYAYQHDVPVVSGETCPTTNGSSITGIAFASAATTYPAPYNTALFFADHSRDCIWAMLAGANGLPDPANRVTLDAGAANPVDLQIGPDGNLYYADLRRRHDPADQLESAAGRQGDGIAHLGRRAPDRRVRRDRLQRSRRRSAQLLLGSRRRRRLRRR